MSLPIGDAIRSVREIKQISQRAAARELKMSHVHLNNLENGHSSPTVAVLERFWTAWGIDVYLLAATMEGRKNAHSTRPRN